jgi:hypothetical protein
MCWKHFSLIFGNFRGGEIGDYSLLHSDLPDPEIHPAPYNNTVWIGHSLIQTAHLYSAEHVCAAEWPVSSVAASVQTIFRRLNEMVKRPILRRNLNLFQCNTYWVGPTLIQGQPVRTVRV